MTGSPVSGRKSTPECLRRGECHCLWQRQSARHGRSPIVAAPLSSLPKTRSRSAKLVEGGLPDITTTPRNWGRTHAAGVGDNVGGRDRRLRCSETIVDRPTLLSNGANL